jgi:uncharacterized protein
MAMTQDANVPPAGAPVPPQTYANPGGIEMNKDARLWGMLAHLSALAGLIIPFGHIIGPLVIWLIKKNEIPFADEQGKESLNFQITVSIAMLICFALMFVAIGIVLLPAVAIGSLIFVIIATIKANNGEHYRYPMTLRLIK